MLKWLLEPICLRVSKKIEQKSDLEITSISISTNDQTAVKPRDLRSNDKSVLNLKRAFELRYPQGFFKTKRGEQAPASCNQDFVIDLVDLGKHLISWHSQRPNIAYNESKLFDKYFEQLFRRGSATG